LIACFAFSYLAEKMGVAGIIGAGMVSRGEVALIIAASGLESGLLLPEYFTAVVIVVILTTLVTPPMLKMVFPKNKQEQHP
jgi:Kef-type K+ transport system membrane component KefB